MSAKPRSRAPKTSAPGHTGSAGFPFYARVAVACVVLAVILAVAFVSAAPVLGPSRLSSTTYYLVVSILGLIAAGSMYGFFWCYDRSHRRHFGLGLEIAAPVAVLVMVLILGLFQPGPNPGFSIVAVIHRQADPNGLFPEGSGRLVLDLGDRQIRRPLDVRGRAVFVRMPEALRGREVGLAIESDTYVLADANGRYLLDGKTIDLTVLKKPQSTKKD
jgi:hypothetical protein